MRETPLGWDAQHIGYLDSLETGSPLYIWPTKGYVREMRKGLGTSKLELEWNALVTKALGGAEMPEIWCESKQAASYSPAYQRLGKHFYLLRLLFLLMLMIVQHILGVSYS